MGWAVGWDSEYRRHIGYGVPCKCEHPDCDKDIDRGLAYRCGDLGDDGCNLFFCTDHLAYEITSYEDDLPVAVCERCSERTEENWVAPFDPKPDTQEWAEHVLTDESWAQWRAENPRQVEAYYAIVAG